MNDETRAELRVAQAICGHLDQSLEHLPHRVGTRLATARQAALAAIPQAAADGRGNLAPARRASAHRPSWPWSRLPGRGWHLGYALVPVLMVGIGLVALSSTSDEHGTDDASAVADTSMFTDEVPLSTYADRGFGVYMRNTLDLGSQGSGMVRAHAPASRQATDHDPERPPPYNP